MNIHIKNVPEFELLRKSSRCQILVGSHLYGLQNESSDRDLLNITAQLENNLNSFVWTHHQYQYKKDNIDYLFTTLNQFVRNLLTGDSTINFEALFSEELKMHNSLGFLYDFRKDFVSYNLIRSYLGFAKRDLKAYRKTKESYKLFHLIRGVETAKILLSGEEYSNNFISFNFHNILLKVKNNQLPSQDIPHLLENYEKNIESLRLDLNEKLQKGSISRSMKTEAMINLDREVIKWNKLHNVSGEILSPDTYSSLFSNIKYEE